MAGKSVTKKPKTYIYIYLLTYIFRRACRGKIGDKIICNNINYIFLKHIFFGGLVNGKSAAKKPQKYKFYFLTYIFWRARENRSATKKTKNTYIYIYI